MEHATVQEGTGGQGTRSVSIRTLSIVMGVVAVVLSVASLVAINNVSRTYTNYAAATDAYFSCQSAAYEMSSASDLLTSEVRIYVTTQEEEHLDHYFKEVNVTKRRDHAVEVITSYLESSSAQLYLDQALYSSNELMERELYAMRLVMEATGAEAPESAGTLLDDVKLNERDAARSPEEQISLAHDLVFDSTYQHYDDLIEQNVQLCKTELLKNMGIERAERSASLDHSLLLLEICIILIVIGFMLTLIGFAVLVLRPIYRFVRHIEQSEPLSDTGSSELRYLSSTYNAMYEETRRNQERLKRKSQIDGLTGIYNRDVFNHLLDESDDKTVALLLIDVDHFKDVNDRYGHVVGDRVLQKVGELLKHTFRQSDFPCRVGGDEFAVLVMGVNAAMAPIVESKIRAIREALLDTSDGLPEITISVGVAFGPLEESMGISESLYQRADSALYVVKETGRNGYRFWQHKRSEE